MRRTGGGFADDLPLLSELDKRLVAVMGGQEFAFGDCQLAVDPFHHSEHQMIQANPLASPAEKINLQSENEEVVIGVCMSPIPGTSQGTPQSPPHKKSKLKSMPRVRQCRSVTRNNQDMEQLVQIEEQRVRAETITAQVFANVSTALDRNAVAVENIARALEGLSAVINNGFANKTLQHQQ
ncbi:unnamed protein product [Parnassius mnemosyne]|uniref:Uncharacterized protein n=1 Tax=Parnassius mnemosyne TaxID=213953 RepID=A0AAV1LT95_9NEOP